MNKIKLLYDIARAMKGQKKIGGVLQVNVQKDREEVFNLRNTFEKELSGKAKSCVSTELNLDGRHMKRESTTEFTLSENCHGHGFMRRLFHRGHHHGGCCGVRGFFSRLSCALGILSSVEVEERENGKATVSVNLNDLPQEMKDALREKLQEKGGCCSHGFLHEGHKLEKLEGILQVAVNEERVIEKITVDLNGSLQDAESESHALAASAEVQFSW